jgi:hypothetical protein
MRPRYWVWNRIHGQRGKCKVEKILKKIIIEACLPEWSWWGSSWQRKEYEDRSPLLL